MRKNTKNAIQRRINAGETNFRIGDKFYTVKASGTILSHFVDETGYSEYGPMIEGVIVNGVFDPDHIFTPEEWAQRPALSPEERE